MEASPPSPTTEAENDQKPPEPSLCRTTIFTAFAIGKSYLFYVEKESRGDGNVRKCWTKVFEDEAIGWKFDRLNDYDKPLGETVTLKLAGCPEATPHIENLKNVFAKLSAELETDSVEAVFFTTGVAVLSIRLTTTDTKNLHSKLQHKNEREEVRVTRLPIIELCQELYQAVMRKAEQHKSEPGELQWSLYNFKQVDRSEWKPKKSYSYHLSFVNVSTFAQRTNRILEQVVGEERRNLQSNQARVSYEGSEVYVDWSEALVSKCENNRGLIENNFIVAFASWCALLLMDGNSSVFLLEAFAGMNSEREQPSAAAVHQRHMAYKDVSDAILPGRWTTKRRDLFLLETIHHNWSSERIRQNIDERMKVLALHYTRLEDERREQFNQRREEFNQRREEFNERREEFNQKLTIIGVIFTLVAFASAIADVTNLWATYKGLSPGFSLIKVFFHFSWALLVAIVIVVIILVIRWRKGHMSQYEGQTQKHKKHE